MQGLTVQLLPMDGFMKPKTPRAAPGAEIRACALGRIKRQSRVALLLVILLYASRSNAGVIEIDFTSSIRNPIPTFADGLLYYLGPEQEVTSASLEIKGSTTAGLLLCNMCFPREACPDDSSRAPVMLTGLFLGLNPSQVFKQMELPIEDDLNVVLPVTDESSTPKLIMRGSAFRIMLSFKGHNGIPECWFEIEPSGTITSLKLLLETTDDSVPVAPDDVEWHQASVPMSVMIDSVVSENSTDLRSPAMVVLQ